MRKPSKGAGMRMEEVSLDEKLAGQLSSFSVENLEEGRRHVMTGSSEELFRKRGSRATCIG